MQQFWKRYAWLYVPGLLFLGLSSYFQVLSPRLLGQLIDELNVQADLIQMTQVHKGLGALLLVALGGFVTRFTWRYFIMGNSRHLETALRRQLFDHLQQLPMQFYQQRKTGDLLVYAINDIGAIRQTFGPGLALSANTIVMSILSITSMSGQVNPRLTLFALMPVPLIIVVILWMGRQVRARFRKVQEAFAAVSDRVQESITGIEVIKAYGQEDEEVERFEQLNRRSRFSNINMTKVSAAMGPVVTVLFGISFSVSLIYGSQLVLLQQLTLGEFVAFNGYLTLIINPVRSIARIINVMQRGMASLKRYQDILSVKPDVHDLPDIKAADSWPEYMTGSLEVRDLTFIYPGETRPALRNINMSLQPGRMVGILGRTGSGKTTLANLLQRLYELPEAAVLLDGQDVRQIPLAVLRRQIAYVPQDNFIFSTTLAENIRFFDDRYTMDDIRQASRLADLDTTVADFPDGYETKVGERGMTLSGGQRQRLGLARALLRKAPFLVLDDALSAVDTETERRILNQLRQEMGRRDAACLIIANRVSALQNCDEILVLSDGEVIERGRHETLLAGNGLYASIASRQSEQTSGGR
ncbi:MAG: ABC transporter ATP-binding protein [Eubacteriales bacterium]|nr:ABC transporter ATP-binding protein [Eubacteriales bacterium]MDD4743487.1 ABC transporter ATP-binding protein [Eubacteriales bacterium]